jgi:hypothetical protein
VLGVKQGFASFNTGGVVEVCETLEQWAHLTGFQPESDNLPEHMIGYSYVLGMWHAGHMN